MPDAAPDAPEPTLTDQCNAEKALLTEEFQNWLRHPFFPRLIAYAQEQKRRFRYDATHHNGNAAFRDEAQRQHDLFEGLAKARWAQNVYEFEIGRIASKYEGKIIANDLANEAAEPPDPRRSASRKRIRV